MIDKSRAFWAGVTGGIVMTILMAMGRWMGMTNMNMAMMQGSMITQTLGPGTWFLGLMMHLIISGMIGSIYAWGFESVTRRASAGIGAGFAIIHAIIGGIVIGMMGAMHPLTVSPPTPVPPGRLLAPGFFAINFGMMTTMAFIVLHLIYGSIVGGMYKTKAQRRRAFPKPEGL